jgi:hypothetical protein
MAKYNELFGQLVQYIGSDPSNLEEGNVWYNSSSNVLKARAYQQGSWSSGDSTNTGRGFMGGASYAATNAALGFGGDTGPARVGNTEEYNGSSWSEQSDMSTGRSAPGSCGIQTSALGWCGYSGGGLTSAEIYNGSSWSGGTAYPGSARYFDGGGTGVSANSAFSFGAHNDAEAYEWNGSSWSASPDMPSTRTYAGGFGTQNSTFITGGQTAISTSITYNGSSFSSAPSINTGRQRFGHAGTSASAGVIWGGSTDSDSDVEIRNTEDWNGSAWSESSLLAVKRDQISNGSGSASSAMNAFGTIRFQPNPTATEDYAGPGVATQTVSTS